MKNSEAKKIISEYRPRTGFFDISNTPPGMNIRDHARLIRAQQHLFHVNDNIVYFDIFHPAELSRVRELSARLQKIILSKWNNILEVDE